MIEQIKNKKYEIKDLDMDEELKSDSLLLISSFLSNLSIKKKSIKELDLSNLKEKYGITDGLIRMNVGIESLQDILADISQALSN